MSAKSKSLSDVKVGNKFPFPYTPEPYTEKEKKILLKFFTNWDKPIFAIHNLPQEVVGAMFSRYSRTAKSVRRLFLDEFFKDQKLGSQLNSFSLSNATERTKNFYKRVFAEYGDDSVIQMGSVHIAFEFVSQLAVKAIEDSRVASAYIEKSTRYVDFGSRIADRYLYIDVPEIVKTSFKKKYKEWNEKAFNTYVESLPLVIEYFRKRYPLDSQLFINPMTGGEIIFTKIKDAEEVEKAKGAYERALKARGFDTIRLFLPLTVVSNLGAHFSGQATENVVNKMLASPLEEVRMVGKIAFEELNKVSPNFLQHVDHKYGEFQRKYKREVRSYQLTTADKFTKKVRKTNVKEEVKLVDFDKDADVKIASQLLFTSQHRGLTKNDIVSWAKKMKKSELSKKKNLKFSPTLVKIIESSIPDRSQPGYNRRHKLPRAFEHVFVELEFCEDYGVYKDLQRNRISSTERQLYLAEGVKVPDELNDKSLKKVRELYEDLAQTTKSLQKEILNSKDERLANAGEYVMLHGNLVRFDVKANLRQWVFFSELRTIEGGHPSYRLAMQKAANLIIDKYPFMKKIFAHVNWTKDAGLGRLRAEIKTQEKLSKIVDTRI